MSQRPKSVADTQARYLDTNPFKIRHEGDYGYDYLTVQMRITYTKDVGAVVFIRKKGEAWIVHSVPFPGKMPKKEVDRLFDLFKRSALKCDKRVKFTSHKGVPKDG